MTTTYAVLSDIHGNLPALEAVIDDASRAGVSRFLIAGDLFSGVPFPLEVYHCLQALDAVIIKGNGEEYLIDYHRGDCLPLMRTARQWAPVRWTVERLGDAEMAWTTSLPEQQVVVTPSLPDIRLVHGSPLRINDGLIPDADPEVLGLFRSAKLLADDQDPPPLVDRLRGVTEGVLICGHLHIPWQQRVCDLLALSPGAVGISNTGDWRASYAILTGAGGQWHVEHRRVEYDRERVYQAYDDSGLLACGGPFVRALLGNVKTGRNAGWQYVLHAQQIARSRGEEPQPIFSEETALTAEETFPWADYGV